jgi:hypothetical protein
MPTTHNHLRSSCLIRASLVLSVYLAMVAISLVSSEGVAKEKTTVMVPVESLIVVLDAAAFGSSAGHIGIKAAPTTWSSRSNVRWNARWTSEGRYLV